jgi:hypothetical protein
MTRLAPPRLTLLVDEPNFATPLAGAEFSFHLAKFLAILDQCASLPRDAVALWLRGHGHGWAWWTDHLQPLAWLGQTGLKLGISAPLGSEVSEAPREMPFKLAWFQVSEAQATAWPCGTVPIARSCHDAPGVATALAMGAAWVTLSPVLPTPSKPGHPGLGWSDFAAVARGYPGRVVALGGLAAGDLPAAWVAGAAGAAVQRAWTTEPAALVAACAGPPTGRA